MLQVLGRAAYTSAYTNAGCEWRLSGRIVAATTSHGESCPQTFATNTDGYLGNVTKPSSSGLRAPIDAKRSGSSVNGPQRLTATSLPFEQCATALAYHLHRIESHADPRPAPSRWRHVAQWAQRPPEPATLHDLKAMLNEMRTERDAFGARRRNASPCPSHRSPPGGGGGGYVETRSQRRHHVIVVRCM
jgi:hypothetical protein